MLMRITTTSLLVPVNKESKEFACMHIQFVEEVGLIVYNFPVYCQLKLNQTNR